MWTDALHDWVLTECHASRVVIESTGLAGELPAGEVRFQGSPCRDHPVLRVEVEGRAFTLRPRLAVWVEVPVARAPAAAGDLVDWTLGEARLGAAGGAFVSPGSWVASVAVSEGQPLTVLNVAPPSDAAAGATVVLAVRAGALEIRSDARLLRDARVGDEVRVFVPATGRVVVGRLVGPDTVEL